MADTKGTHVSEEKKFKVKELSEQMKRKTVMIVSIKGLPSAQFQDIKKKLRGRADVIVAKKSIVNFALDHCGIKELHELIKYVDNSTAILFSDEDAFEISEILASEKSPAKAKAGQIAPTDIEVKAGPTDLLPGPDISALSSVGLAPKVEEGKITIMHDKIIAKKGSVISLELASIMAKLNIVPFKIGIEPVAAYMDRKVYVDIKINKEETLKELINLFSRSLAFSVEIEYVCEETLDYILGRVGLEGAVLNEFIKKNSSGEANAEKDVKKVKKEVKVEETKTEGGD